VLTRTGPPPELLADDPVVALDVHGVVFNNPLPYFLAELGARSELGANRFKRRWRSTLRVPFWEGRLSEAELWAEVAPGLDPDLVRADLERRYRRGPWFDFVATHDGPLWLLTNHRTDWLRPRLERFGIADRFERILVSDVLGVAKPSPGAFAPLLEHRVVFFDDSASNVDTAQRLGITARRVTRSGAVVDPAVARQPGATSLRNG
jgi:putative hydrolase of the HAD superfamily